MAEPIRNLNTPAKSGTPSSTTNPAKRQERTATLRSEIANLREMLAEKTEAALRQGRRAGRQRCELCPARGKLGRRYHPRTSRSHHDAVHPDRRNRLCDRLRGWHRFRGKQACLV